MFHQWVHETPIAFALTIAACLGLPIVASAWRRRARPGGDYLALMVTAGMLWLLFYALELSFSDVATKLFWARFEYLGVATVSVFWFLFARAYAGAFRRPPARSLVLLSVIPAVTLVLVATNSLHGLIWSSARIEGVGSFPALVLKYGPWFWVNLAYQYCLLTAGGALLLRGVRHYPSSYRKQAWLLFAAVLVPWMGNAFTLFFSSELRVDLTPPAFLVSGLILLLAYSRLRLHGLLPGLLASARTRALDRMRDGAIVVDLEGRVVSMSSAASALLRGHGVTVGCLMAEALPALAEAMASSRDIGELHSELTLKGSGGPSHLDAISIPLPGEGAGMGWLLVVRDIGERKAAADALRASENRFRGVIEQFAEGFFLTDETGRVTEWNQAMENISGLPRSEALGRFAWELHFSLKDQTPSPERLEQVKAMVLEALATGDCALFGHPHEADLTTPAGERRRVQEIAFPVRTGDHFVIGHAVRDITEQERARAALRESEARYRSLVEASHDWIWEADEQGRYTFASPKVEEVLGYLPEEVMGKSVFDFMPEDEAAKVAAHSAENMGRWRSFVDLRTVNRHKDGHLVTVERNCCPIFDDTGEFRGFRGTDKDVTERTRMEEKIVRSEEHFRALIEYGSDLVCVVDANGILEFQSPSSLPVLGYRPEELVGLNAFSHVHPDDIVRVRRAFVEFRRGERDSSESVELRFAHKERGWLVLEVKASKLIEGGRLSGYVLNSRDITARKEMEQALSLTQLSVDRANDSIFWLDETGRVTYVNDASCRRLGYTREELLAKTVFDLDPLAPSPWSSHFQEVKEKGSLRFETTQFTRDGNSLPVEIVANHVSSNGHEYIFAYARDIAEQRRSEEALRESEGRFRAVFENTAIGVALFDSQGRVLKSNPALEKMLGYSATELAGLRFVSITHPEDAKREGRLLRELIRGSRDHYQLEKRFVRKGGEPIWVQMTGSLVRDNVGTPLYGIGMVVDIAERKEAERALRESEEQLRQALKMEAVGQLAGGIAHDFNNLLMVIIGNTTLALADMSEDDPKQPFLVDIQEAGEQAASLTKQILAFSRKQILRPQAVRLSDIVQGVEPLLRRTLGEHIDLIFLLAPGLQTIEVDPHQTEQVIMNLAINARDAMACGGLLTIETANVELDKAHCRAHPHAKPGPHVMLAVSDTGCGMSEQTIERIFEPFFTTKGAGRGTGLGLSTVFGIVRQSGGSISVESQPGEGSTFRVFFPVARTVVGPSGTARGAGAGQRGSETVLVVEDEAGARELIVRALAGSGYRVLEAGSAAEVELALAGEESAPDLVLMDVVLPGGLSGRDIADGLIECNPGLSIVFMSGYTRDLVMHNGRLDEGIDILEKPFPPEVLLAKVRTVLDEAGPVAGRRMTVRFRGRHSP